MFSSYLMYPMSSEWVLPTTAKTKTESYCLMNPYTSEVNNVSRSFWWFISRPYHYRRDEELD